MLATPITPVTMISPGKMRLKNPMVSKHVRWLAAAGKVLAAVSLLPLASFAGPSESGHPIRLLLDQPPASLNPRSTLDGAGQRINSLLYSGLTRIDQNLLPQPDLASSWETRKGGKEVAFRIRSGISDHSGRAITAADLRACMEEFRRGKPVSPYISSFPTWIGTRSTDHEVVFELSGPDPYLLRNVSLLRYFRTPKGEPCNEPKSEQTLIGSGPYRMEPWDPLPETKISLLPVDPKFAPVEISYIGDDNTRVLSMVNGDFDATLDALTLAKERWLQKRYAERFQLIERRGTRMSYLSFNMRDPFLARKEVRQALALAINRDEIVRSKLFDFATAAGSFLSPDLPESFQKNFEFNPEKAEAILDRAGLPRKGPEKVRFELHYKTTPVREGFETALIFRQMWARIGVRITLEVVEPAVFLQSVRKGAYQIYSSRWLGIADGSILYRTLESRSPDNRAGYRNAQVDTLLQKSIADPDQAKRLAAVRDVQKIISEDLPYFPLWYWHEGLIVKRGHPWLGKIAAQDLSLSGALEPILLLR